MPWVIGVDEAGYGPNLGPLVQAAVAVRLPADDAAGWNTLRPLVRRACEADDGRLLLDDSKAVYKPPHGLAKLERGVLALLAPRPADLAALVRTCVLATHHSDLYAEAWFDAAHALPVAVAVEALAEPFTLTEVLVLPPLAAIVPTPRFNRVVDESDSKATILARGLIELLTAAFANLPDDGEPLLAVCDKQGGRNFYNALVQAAFPAGWVAIEREGAEESRYRVDGLARAVTVVFRPKADAVSVSVAVASMLCKYLREVCMRQFNRYWLGHVPGLEPTAGYPLDARRFYEAIRAAMTTLGFTEDQVWRKR